MLAKTVVGLALLSIVLLTSWYFFNQSATNYNQPSPSPTITNSLDKVTDNSNVVDSGDSERPPTKSEELPTGWTQTYDGQLGYQAAFPSDFVHWPATDSQSESAFYSFNPSQAAGRGGISPDQIKIAVARFAANDNRQLEQSGTDTTSLQVDNHSATAWTASGMGEVRNTLVELDSGERYLISAYPANSELLPIYEQFLKHIDLDAVAPINLQQPTAQEEVDSPLEVVGQAPGNWLFEGQLNIALHSYDGEILAQTTATSNESWMTDDMITFQGQLSFVVPDDFYGYLVVTKTNPSGIPEQGLQFTWPVKFK